MNTKEETPVKETKTIKIAAVDPAVANDVLKYLGTRPYQEVADLVTRLKTAQIIDAVVQEPVVNQGPVLTTQDATK